MSAVSLRPNRVLLRNDLARALVINWLDAGFLADAAIALHEPFIVHREYRDIWISLALQPVANCSRHGQESVTGLVYPSTRRLLHHAIGFHFASDGVGMRVVRVYLGNSNITHTARYRQPVQERFRSLWRD